jgi:hypothetical protein
MKIENNFRVCIENLRKRHQFRMLRACWTRIYIQPRKKAMPCRIENPLLRFLFQTLNPEAQESLYSQFQVLYKMVKSVCSQSWHEKSYLPGYILNVQH